MALDTPVSADLFCIARCLSVTQFPGALGIILINAGNNLEIVQSQGVTRALHCADLQLEATQCKSNP